MHIISVYIMKYKKFFSNSIPVFGTELVVKVMSFGLYSTRAVEQRIDKEESWPYYNRQEDDFYICFYFVEKFSTVHVFLSSSYE